MNRRANRTLVLGAALLVLAISTSPAWGFGSLDPSFDGDGKATLNGPGSGFDSAQRVAIQPDGKIVVVGRMDVVPGMVFDSDIAVLRYNPDGTLDGSFDGDTGSGNGVVTVPLGPPSDADFANGVAIQGDGKIVVVGSVIGATTADDIAVVRLNTDGKLDDVTDSTPAETFDTDGIATTPVGAGTAEDFASGVAIQTDGKIVVSGGGPGATTASDFAVLRYNTDGTLDPAFDGDAGPGNGIVLTDFTGAGNEDFGSDVSIQPSDGKIVVMGNALVGADNDFALARYNASTGTLDTSFDMDGKVTTSFAAGATFARAGAVQSDGKIVVGGFLSVGTSDVALARYNTDGGLDASFDGPSGTGDGAFLAPIAPAGNGDSVQDLAIQSDGQIVIAGVVDGDPGPGGDNNFALARFNATDGSFDPSFGSGGVVMTSFAGPMLSEAGRGLAIQADGRIVAVGEAEGPPGNGIDVAIARFGPDPPPSATLPPVGAPQPPATPAKRKKKCKKRKKGTRAARKKCKKRAK